MLSHKFQNEYEYEYTARVTLYSAGNILPVLQWAKGFQPDLGGQNVSSRIEGYPCRVRVPYSYEYEYVPTRCAALRCTDDDDVADQRRSFALMTMTSPAIRTGNSQWASAAPRRISTTAPSDPTRNSYQFAIICNSRVRTSVRKPNLCESETQMGR